jgi:quinol monooxygenase YgiN
MWEKFKDTHAVKIHDESPHYKKFESQMNDLMQEPIQLIELGKVLN